MNLSRILNLSLIVAVVAMLAAGGLYLYSHILAASPQGALQQKIDVWKDALANNPDDAAAHANLGALYRDAGRLDDSVEELRKAVALDQEGFTYMFELGLTCLETGNTDEALDNFSRAAEMYPEHEKYRAYYQMAKIYLEKGDLPAAREYGLKAVEDNDMTWNVHYLLGQIFQQEGDTTQARQHYEAAAKFNPENTEITEALQQIT